MFYEIGFLKLMCSLGRSFKITDAFLPSLGWSDLIALERDSLDTRILKTPRVTLM